MRVPYWRLSSFYFFYFATLGVFLPYWSLYLHHRDFTLLEIGELSALLMGSKIISPNFFGVIADYTGKGLKIIRLISFFTAFLFTGFLFKSGHLWFAVITFGFSFFWNAALPQFEALTLIHLHNKPYQYSQIRLWGSIGFILAVVGVGQLLDQYPLSLLPLVVMVLFIFLWLSAMIAPDASTHSSKYKSTGLWRIFKQPEMLGFLVVFLLLQASHGPYYFFYSIHLEQLGYSSQLIGYLWALGVISEVILLLFSHTLLTLFSLRHLLLWSLFLSILRWLIIAQMADSLYWMIGAQCLHAASFGLSHVTAIHLVRHYFGDQHQGKGQALYSSMSFGLGGMLGGLLSGYYWETVGATIIYNIAACFCCLAFLISFFVIKQRG